MVVVFFSYILLLPDQRHLHSPYSLILFHCFRQAMFHSSHPEQDDENIEVVTGQRCSSRSGTVRCVGLRARALSSCNNHDLF